MAEQFGVISIGNTVSTSFNSFDINRGTAWVKQTVNPFWISKSGTGAQVLKGRISFTKKISNLFLFINGLLSSSQGTNEVWKITDLTGGYALGMAYEFEYTGDPSIFDSPFLLEVRTS